MAVPTCPECNVFHGCSAVSLCFCASQSMLPSRGLGARKREGLGRTLPVRLVISLTASAIAIILLLITIRSSRSGQLQAGKGVQSSQERLQRQAILAYVGVQVGLGGL